MSANPKLAKCEAAPAHRWEDCPNYRPHEPAPLDPATIDLLKAITEALAGVADWRAVAVTVATERAQNGFDDPGAAADWLREFLAQREAAERTAEEMEAEEDREQAADEAQWREEREFMGKVDEAERDPQTDWLTAAEREAMRR